MNAAQRLRPHFWHDQRYPLVRLRQAIERSLARVRGDVVIDVGAGEAPYRPLFERAGRRYVACDLAGTPDIRFSPGDDIPLPRDSADVVVSFQVLEHVWDLDWYLAECARLLRPDGTLLLSTHGVWLHHPHPTDFRRWTCDGLIEELRTRGFEPTVVQPVVGPLAWPGVFYLIALANALGRVGVVGRVLFAPFGALGNLMLPLLDRMTPRDVHDSNAAIYVVEARQAHVSSEG